MKIELKPFIAKGSDTAVNVHPEDWENPQEFIQYCVEYATGVILQRASAGKKDDPEKAEKAIDQAKSRIKKGIPAAGGVSRLTPEEKAMRAALKSVGYPLKKGDTIANVIETFTEALAKDQGKDFHPDMIEKVTKLLEGSIIYKTTLEANKPKESIDLNGLEL